VNLVFERREICNPPVAEGKSVSHITKMSKNIFKLLISVFNNCQKEIDRDSHAEI